MPVIDDELGQIERDIRTLKIEFEQFFGGGRKRPPTDTQWRVENLIKRWAERMAELSYGQRFRYNNLTQTYAKYQEMWRKKLVQKESGAQQRHFGAAAKAIEAERARTQVPAGGDGHARPQEDDHRAGRKAKSHGAAAFALRFSDPSAEKPKVEELYRKLIEARAGTGEQSGAPSFTDFEHFVVNKTRELRKKGAREVEYTVTVEGRHVKLKAKVSK
ncbi:MAG TPA: MXAN_5187 C-terminal domain-containing protein [Candidatus Cybelea sp.]|nr:MXAN_5187 C-terminal domain-containing protein [Candidatus Cybelea sp.]